MRQTARREQSSVPTGVWSSPAAAAKYLANLKISDNEKEMIFVEEYKIVKYQGVNRNLKN